MKATLHLISMPWADPELPSIQIAALKAQMDSIFGGKLTTHTYSAFAAILLERRRNACVNYSDKLDDFEEYPYFFLCIKRYLHEDANLRRISIGRLMSRMNSYDLGEPITPSTLRFLESKTKRYIERRIAPRLDPLAVNLVGFTLNYYQLYASIYAAKFLQKRFPAIRFVFLFGGATVIYPKVAQALKLFAINGLCVIGEGERKLELVVRKTLDTPLKSFSSLVEQLAALHPAIYSIQTHTQNLYEPDRTRLLEMQTPMDQLPIPSLAEYYVTLRQTLGRGKVSANFKMKSWMVLEGTRGCFAHCDFCDVHTSWMGFRKTKGKAVAERTLQLARQHRSSRIKFMDNVCDTWAAEYAEALINQNIRVTSFMECRVHHPQVFWTKLALSGVVAVQVGIESFVPALIKAMNKGTTAHQNLLVQKWLKELGIESMSNLISHHPKSTLEHVEHTRRILELIPHLDRLTFSPLGLVLGSPLDRTLSPTERRELKERQLFSLPKALDPFFVLKGEYEPPAKWSAKEVLRAWDQLIRWEDQFAKARKGAFMTCQTLGEERLLIIDGRAGVVEEHCLEGATARIYGLCHQGMTVAALVRATGLMAAQIEGILYSLQTARLLVELDSRHISLATRPRDELVQAYLSGPQELQTASPMAHMNLDAA